MSNIRDNSLPDRFACDGNDDPIQTMSNEPSSLQVDVNVDQQWIDLIDQVRLADGAMAAAAHRGFHQGKIGIRVADDQFIQEINRRHLQHDYATDVISFPYVHETPNLHGEMVVSFDTARREAEAIGWNAERELLLYVVHGALHLTGMEDTDDESRQSMRRAEREVLTRLGVEDIDKFGADRRPSDSHSEDSA